jgi:hypothetical protein
MRGCDRGHSALTGGRSYAEVSDGMTEAYEPGRGWAGQRSGIAPLLWTRRVPSSRGVIRTTIS